MRVVKSMPVRVPLDRLTTIVVQVRQRRVRDTAQGAPMAELTIRQVEAEILAKLKERADEHCRSVEEEHRQMLTEVG